MEVGLGTSNEAEGEDRRCHRYEYGSLVGTIAPFLQTSS